MSSAGLASLQRWRVTRRLRSFGVYSLAAGAASLGGTFNMLHMRRSAASPMLSAAKWHLFGSRPPAGNHHENLSSALIRHRRDVSLRRNAKLFDRREQRNRRASARLDGPVLACEIEIIVLFAIGAAAIGAAERSYQRRATFTPELLTRG